MAPITSTTVGITPQLIDDDRLKKLKADLGAISIEAVAMDDSQLSVTASPQKPPLDIDHLAEICKPWHKWVFDEQIDLQEWAHPLNLIDASLVYYMRLYPALLLVSPIHKKKNEMSGDQHPKLPSKPATNLQETALVPEQVRSTIVIVLRFLSSMINNSFSKSAFNSVNELVSLLAAADDEIAAAALEALTSLATPPAAHKQQAPELNQHSTALHRSRDASHKRLMALARGWGSRGSGLGLFSCVSADDSEFGQGALPAQAGELNFTFYQMEKEENGMDTTSEEDEDQNLENDESKLIRVHLAPSDVFEGGRDGSNFGSDSTGQADIGGDDTKQQKRRKVAQVIGNRTIKSTAELFFLCIEKAGGSLRVPQDRLFSLLADIRLIRAFHSQEKRVEAVKRRLRALIAILYAHPSHEIVSGYFHAQPELCVELIDLLRPTVSSASISAAPTGAGTANSNRQKDALDVLAKSTTVPYEVRLLAVEALTALVSRRDGTGIALTGSVRHVTILSELGVGKGQYLGLLPTLIRFSLASLSSFLSHTSPSPGKEIAEEKGDDRVGFDLGLAFAQATKDPPLPWVDQVERALEFIDAVLTLTFSVIGTPSGTSSLTDCGLIPALLTTISIDSTSSMVELRKTLSETEANRIESLLRVITAQAVQIIEGAIVTHSNPLNAFHDLQGVEILTRRLANEILEQPPTNSPSTPITTPASMQDSSEAVPMDCDTSEPQNPQDMASPHVPKRDKMQTSQRVLLFSIVTCLTVVFHHESTSSSATTPSGATEIRKPPLTATLIEIMDNVEVYGGHLASLTSALMADVMNSDPHVVKHVYQSGMATSFLSMVKGEVDGAPLLPTIPELVMAIPNVLSALALTEDGAKSIKEANPFPALLKLFHHPKYAMPNSRCLLNEMTAIVGTALDEIMRHVSLLKPLVLEAIAQAMVEVTKFGDEVSKREESTKWSRPVNHLATTQLETDRTCLMQYALNFGQLLEQILHNEDHCDPFVAAGGLEALLSLHANLMPSGYQFLAHVSCLSCPAVSTLTHSTTEDSLTLAFKCIALRYDPFKLLQTLVNKVSEQIQELESTHLQLLEVCPSKSRGTADAIDAKFLLEGLPKIPLHQIEDEGFTPVITLLSSYLRRVVTLQWSTSLLAAVIRAACQRSQDAGTGWSRNERNWKKELSSTNFEELLARLARFQKSSIFEVCRIRTEPDFDERELNRLKGNTLTTKGKQLRYRLRIVCAEGAVVRDGIEIDSCASVGSMEMGEIADAYDRCVNSSGVLRYRTRRGWVSEQTRGHGREPIAEVLAIWESDTKPPPNEVAQKSKGRIETGVTDICTASATVLARMQSSYSELFSSLARVVAQGLRSLPVQTLSFQEGTIEAHIATTMKLLTTEIQDGFNRKEVVQLKQAIEGNTYKGPNAASMYLGCMLGQLHACLIDEKRERKMLNIPLLIALVNVHNSNEGTMNDNISFLDAIIFVLKAGLNDFESMSLEQINLTDDPKLPRQVSSRTSASSLPPLVNLVRRLLVTASITTSPLSSVLNRVSMSKLAILLGEKPALDEPTSSAETEETFSPDKFSRQLQCHISDCLNTAWQDSKMKYTPPHVLNPIVSLVAETLAGLEESSKKNVSSSIPLQRNDPRLPNPFRGLFMNHERLRNETAREEPFELSEDTVLQLIDMGFDRERAYDAIQRSRSNNVEVSLQYALSHPPPSPSTIQRNRTEREQQSQAAQERQNATAPTNAENGTEALGAASGEGAQASENSTENTGQINAGSAPEVDADSSAAANDAMDVDENKAADRDSGKEDGKDDITKTMKDRVDTWKKGIVRVACEIIESGTYNITPAMGEGTHAVCDADGDGEKEASTTVLSSFLLDLCQRYPDERIAIVKLLLQKLKSQMESVMDGDTAVWRVVPGHESNMAALCHAVVLFTRALPKTRILLLKNGLVGRLLSTVQVSLKSNKKDTDAFHTAEQEGTAAAKWPVWMSFTILLLDIMAQPMVISDLQDPKSTDNNTDLNDNEDNNDEYILVQAEHKERAKEFADKTDLVFSTFTKRLQNSANTNAAKETDKEGNQKDKQSGAEEATEPPVETSSIVNAFETMPAYHSLLSGDASDTCLRVCLSLLRRALSCPRSGVVHATLLLLMRLLRNPSYAAVCLKAGVVEKLLALPRGCRFTGHIGLVNLILRRLLEDEATLQASMETEIRNSMVKLQGKKGARSDTSNEKSVVSGKALLQTLTPLLCRNPLSLTKALFVSVKFDKNSPSIRTDPGVSLYPWTERCERTKHLADMAKHTPGKPRQSMGSRQRRSSGVQGARSKTPRRDSKRGQTPKKGKREKAEKAEEGDQNKSSHHVVDSPATNVVNLLVNKIAHQAKHLRQKGVSKPTSCDFAYSDMFLWAAELLDIMADLAIAIPACAAAMHKYRHGRAKENSKRVPLVLANLQHALIGGHTPPRSFLCFLLHVLLPQDRWTSKKQRRLQEPKASDDSVEAQSIRQKRLSAFQKIRVAQASARVLLALVARPGDGRRKVVAELVFAFSSGRLGHNPIVADLCDSPIKATQMHAINAWGELCTGLVAPRNNGSSYDGNSSLSFDVIKIMFEFGMIHALMLALHRIPLHHPMAAAVCGSIMLPLEIMTRTSVNDAVIATAKKEADSRLTKTGQSKTAPGGTGASSPKNGNAASADPRASLGDRTNSRSTSIGQDLDEGFIGGHGTANQQGELEMDSESDDDDDDLDDGLDDDDGDDIDDGGMMMMDDNSDDLIDDEDDTTSRGDGDEDEDDMSEDSDSSDESSSSQEGSDEEDMDEGMDAGDGGEDSNSVIDGSSTDESEQGIDQDGAFHSDFHGMANDVDPEMEADDTGTDRVDSALDEGWTRIDSAGFGGMLMGNRRGHAVRGAAGMTARTRGFVDAAEAMIGTLLQSGEIRHEALADLGIRIVQEGGAPGSIRGALHGATRLGLDFGGQTSNDHNSTDEMGARTSRNSVDLGTLPLVQQRTHPEVGYTTLNGGHRWNEISSMEYVFGGPSITAGSRNYDLISPMANLPNPDAPTPTLQNDGQLFPGGPSSATHARTQHLLHPLLCGVDLPPVNSLVSDLLSHGARSVQSDQVTARRPGEWTVSSFSSGAQLVSTSTGNIIRSSRAAHGGNFTLFSRGNTAAVGWTDDGLPFDSTIQELGAVFETALTSSMAISTTHSDPSSINSTPAGQRDSGATLNDLPGVSSTTDAGGSGLNVDVDADDGNIDDIDDTNENEDEQYRDAVEAGDVAEEASPPLQAENEEQPQPDTSNDRDGDGDGVASSLAEGLRLSPRSDENSEAVPSAETALDGGGDDVGNASGDVDDGVPSNQPIGEVQVSTESQDATMEDEADASAPNQLSESVETSAQPSEPASQIDSNDPQCPPGMDLEVFNSLPVEMQQEVVQQARAEAELVAQLDAGSALDPEVLAALPEDMRREAIEQEQRERRLAQQAEAPADPANAEEMDNASFIASLSPELRNEILLTADDSFLQSLRPEVVAEAHLLRERATSERRVHDNEQPTRNQGAAQVENATANAAAERNAAMRAAARSTAAITATSRRKQRSGKIRVETERENIVFLPDGGPLKLGSPFAAADIRAFLRLFYLIAPIRPFRLLQKSLSNLASHHCLRRTLSTVFIHLLHDDNKQALAAVDQLVQYYGDDASWRQRIDSHFSNEVMDFPPRFLIGAAPEILDNDRLYSTTPLQRRPTGDTVASIAANLPMSARGSSKEESLPSVVADRIVDSMQYLCKNSARFCLDLLLNQSDMVVARQDDQLADTGFDRLLDLLEKPRYSKSSANLEHLLTVLESAVSPLSHISKHGDDDVEISQREIDTAAAAGKQWVDVPRVEVSQKRLQILCSILRMETCRDASFTKVNTIVRRLCRLQANRGHVLAELASVAHALGVDAIGDLKTLNIRMSGALARNESQTNKDSDSPQQDSIVLGSASNSVAVSTSTSELKLLRVLQTLQSLCVDTSDEASSKKNDGNTVVTYEMVHLLKAMDLDNLWDELTSCLKVVQVLEGVSAATDEHDDDAENNNDDNNSNDNNGTDEKGSKKLQNTVAGLLTRFLPSIEAFFVANASITRNREKEVADEGQTEEGIIGSEIGLDNLVGGRRLLNFVSANKILVNALIRNNPSLLDKGLRTLIQVPQCRILLSFDVKRHWFKTQVRRLRQQASRRFGSLRLQIRREHVFEDAYHWLLRRNADEMRGRLHITFRDEEGVDAGGLSREFFGILAKEIFNPNYALFTSTEDGCTFQPNPNSSINPDHLSFFRFVGRIVGKAVADGYLLDAHFTRSLYKHMLGIKPTHHDMEAIDPDYYKNLKTILEYDLEDLGLDLTFSIEDYSFGRNQIIDLIPDGRKTKVTEETKAKYVSLVCQHRMTASISSQIKAYLDGFYELVSRDLISIFSPKELELLISGLPDIDVHDLKKNTEYHGWKATDKQVQWFWNVLFSLSRNEKASFLQFVTGSSKVPLAGFSELPGMRGVQKFSIHKATAGSSGALMSAHTCFNSLDLPPYDSEEKLKEKLLYAINEGTGAFLFA